MVRTRKSVSSAERALISSSPPRQTGHQEDPHQDDHHTAGCLDFSQVFIELFNLGQQHVREKCQRHKRHKKTKRISSAGPFQLHFLLAIEPFDMDKPRLMKPQNDDNGSYHNHERFTADDRPQCSGTKAQQNEAYGNPCDKENAFAYDPQPARAGLSAPEGPPEENIERYTGSSGTIQGEKKDSSPAVSTVPRYND